MTGPKISREEWLAMPPEELARRLPPNVEIVIAGWLIGIGRTKSYLLARQGKFPLELRPVGNDKYRVPRSLLLDHLRIPATAASEASAA